VVIVFTLEVLVVTNMRFGQTQTYHNSLNNERSFENGDHSSHDNRKEKLTLKNYC
jgi:hypothetical protein